MIETNNITPIACPYCGVAAERTMSHFEGLTPKPNHVTMCADCFGLCQFNDDLTLRKIDPEKFAELRRNTEFWRYLEATRNFLKFLTRLEDAAKKNPR